MSELLHEKKLRNLEKLAGQIRQTLVEVLFEAGSGHSASSFGVVDMLTAFYFHILNHDPKKPNWPDRDKFVVSNGHICPAQYTVMAYAGYFLIEELKTLRKLNSKLQGHPHRRVSFGIETTSGPLGCGLSQAIGMALAAKLDGKKNWIYCITSDGEHQEGNIWEAVMFAGKQKHDLNNLISIVDRNNIQIDGFTEEVMPLESLVDKYEAFNWHVIEVDGHNIRDLVDAVNEAKAIYESPTVIIAHTISGKGIGFMEGDYKWHGRSPDKEQAKKALKELKTKEAEMEFENQ